MDVWIRINGRGNAWPLELGSNDARHRALRDTPNEYANTSLSVIGAEGVGPEGHPAPDNVRWEVLVDIGQGVIPNLIGAGNRLPNALVLTHPHFDHVSGLDWFCPSYKRHRADESRRMLPERPTVYATEPCLAEVFGATRFYYLTADIDRRPVRLGEPFSIPEADPNLKVTAFPVYHGPYAPGAALWLVEFSGKKAILTGDLLCPLLREDDLARLSGPTLLIADANTRYPWPESGHWSITARDPANPSLPQESVRLTSWKGQNSVPRTLLSPHADDPSPYAERLRADFASGGLGRAQLSWSVFDFARLVSAESVQLVHYSGYEDTRYRQEGSYGGRSLSVDILDDSDLRSWANNQARLEGVDASIDVPLPGQWFPLS